jgi:hypothetical protein
LLFEKAIEESLELTMFWLGQNTTSFIVLLSHCTPVLTIIGL